MRLGIIDRDEYRQVRYWELFQKLLLTFASGFTVAGVLLEPQDVRHLSQAVAGVLWVLVVATVALAAIVGKRMVRELPGSLQSLLMFSTEGGEVAEARPQLTAVERAEGE